MSWFEYYYAIRCCIQLAALGLCLGLGVFVLVTWALDQRSGKG